MEVGPTDRATEYQFLVAHQKEGSKFNKTYNVQARPLFLKLRREMMISGLGSGLTFTLKARAVNRVGTGKWSGSIIVTTISSKNPFFFVCVCLFFCISTTLHCKRENL